jgi:hypothetical protein
VELAQQVESAPGLRLLGPFGYEGHCMLEPDRELRIRKAQDSNAQLIELADAFERDGLPTEIVGAGGLGTWDITGANPRITEIHAGSYIFMDAFHRALCRVRSGATVLDRDLAHRGWRSSMRPQGDRHRLPSPSSWDRGEVRFEHGEHFIHEEHTALMLADEPEVASADRPADARIRADDGQPLRLLLSSRTRWSTSGPSAAATAPRRPGRAA